MNWWPMPCARSSVSKRTLIKRSLVEETVNAHDCQGNKKHRLRRGDRRLAIWKDRSPERYCEACARDIIQRDIAKLTMMAKQLDGVEPLGHAPLLRDP
jgi:hypothetical protein